MCARDSQGIAFVINNAESYNKNYQTGIGGQIVIINESSEYAFELLRRLHGGEVQGEVIQGADVTIKISNDVTKTLKTDKNGQVKLSVNGLSIKTYTASVTFSGFKDYISVTKTVTVTIKKATPKLTAKAKSFKKSIKTKKYAVTLKTNNNKVVKNTKVTLKVNGKTYIAKTNGKSVATFKINKLTKKGKFTATVNFAGNNFYTAKTVKS